MRALAMRQTSLTGDKACGANITMGAEVSGSLRRTPSRPPRSALGASMAWRYAPERRAAREPSSIFSAKSSHDSGDSVPRLGDDRQTGPDFLVRGEAA